MKWQLILITVLVAGLASEVKAGNALVEEIRRDLATAPRDTVDRLNNGAMSEILKEGEFAAVEEFAVAGTIAVADDPARIEQLQKYRVKALLADRRPQEALQAAKALFNVCTMHFVVEALPLITETLAAKNPGDSALIAKFKLQVLANSQEDAAARAQLAGQYGGNAIMQNMPADPEPYGAAIKALASKTDYKSLCSAANLELLSGHIGRAADLLDNAYKAAPESDINGATEGLARKLKARDAAIGRANQFVNAIRPAE